jgi:hypothetical protein
MKADGLKLPFQDRWRRMQSAQGEHEYYALTLTADTDGKINWSSQTVFLGWEDRKRRWELRGPRTLTAAFADHWKAIKQPYVFVHSAEDYFVFLICGGNALIEKEIANERLADLLKTRAVAPRGPAGFKVLESVAPAALQRSPKAKLRMQILNRDGRRCKICGRRPDDDVDLELHVHHVRPSGKGGLSESENLITLYDTCHTGLYPHDDFSLFEYIPEFKHFLDTDHDLRELTQGIARYRKISLEMYHASKEPSCPGTSKALSEKRT